VRSF